LEQSLRTSHGPGSPSPSGDRLRKAIERNRAKRAKKNPKPSNQAVLTPPPPRENLNRNTGVESNRKAALGRAPQRRVPPRRSSAPVHAPVVQKRPDHLRDTLEELENFDDFDVYDEEDEFDEEDFEEVPSEEPYHQVSRQAPPRAQRSPRSARPMSPPQRPPKRERTPPPPPRRSAPSQENLRHEKRPRELPKSNGLGARKKEASRPPRTNHISSHKKPFKFPGFIQRRIDGIRSFLGPREKWLRFLKKLSWLVCFILLARLVLSDRGVLDYFSQKKNYEKKIQKLSFLHDHKLDLKKKIKLIKNNKFHQKKLVRDHLGFISKDEFLILFQKGK
tara:strand:+ start:739 stop:1740 length:1002 start_codon:yes stop_codon:yes gene_type:complete